MKWTVLVVLVLLATYSLALPFLSPNTTLHADKPLVMQLSCCSEPNLVFADETGGPGEGATLATSEDDTWLNSDGETGTIEGKLGSRWFKRKEGAVFVREVKGRTFPPPKKNPAMDQKDLTFIPHVLPIVVGSTVDFLNNDNVKHNVHSTKKSPTQFNLGLFGSGTTKQVKFDKQGTVTLLCNVHAEMSAYLLVCQNPYFSRVDMKDASFKIENVPTGTYKIAVFHEKVKTADIDVTVKAGEVTTATFGKFKKK